MSRNFFLPSVLNLCDLEILQQIFTEHKIQPDVDTKNHGTKKKKDNPWHSIQQLPTKQLDTLHNIFESVHQLAADKEGRILTELFTEFGEGDEIKKWVGKADPHTVAAWAYLTHRRLFEVAVRIHEIDLLPRWRKRTHIPHVPLELSEVLKTEFVDKVKGLYAKEYGHCGRYKLETYRCGDREYVMVYGERQANKELILNDFDEIEHLRLRPLFEVGYIYNRKVGTLELVCPGKLKIKFDLEKTFAQTFLKLELKDLQSKTYILNTFRQLHTLTTLPEDGVIADIVSMKYKPQNTERILILQANPSFNDFPKAYEECINKQGASLDNALITEVLLRFQFPRQGTPEPDVVKVKLTTSGWGLAKDREAQTTLIEKYLSKWGICATPSVDEVSDLVGSEPNRDQGSLASG